MSNKTYSTDANGTSVAWVTGPWPQTNHVKYVSGPRSGEHYGYDPKTGRMFYAGHAMPRQGFMDALSGTLLYGAGQSLKK